MTAPGGAALLRANALAVPLAAESVDLIVTSPPYFALRSYADGGEHYDGQIGSEASPKAFLAALWAVMDECWRVLKPSGSCWVNLGDKYAGSGGHNNAGISGGPSKLQGASQRRTDFTATRRSAPDRYNQAADVRPKSRMLLPHRFAEGCIDPEYRRWVTGYDHPDRVWICRMDAVWSKPNGMPESVTDRVRASHEYWFHLTKSERYFSAIDEIREAHSEAQRPGVMTWADRKGRTDAAARYSDQNGHGGTAGMAQNPLGKLPGSVWTVPSEPLTVPDWVGVDHFAAFPTEFPRRIILGWSPPDGTILDPFGGTGTTAMVARALGRYGISIDLSADYLRLADWRIHQSGHWAKAVERTTGRPCTPDQPIHGQLGLFQ